jgi:hypothetical protein
MTRTPRKKPPLKKRHPTLGALVTLRQVRANREGHSIELFTKAIDLLANIQFSDCSPVPLRGSLPAGSACRVDHGGPALM